MPQQHRRARFDLKPDSCRLIFNEALMQNLDRDGTIHLKMSRTIHSPHSARTEAFFYRVLLVERSTYERVLRFEHRHGRQISSSSGVNMK
jgi:hypothetical protein